MKHKCFHKKKKYDVLSASLEKKAVFKGGLHDYFYPPFFCNFFKSAKG